MAIAKHITQNEPIRIDPSLLHSEAGKLRVIKRNGAVVPYDESKITVALTKAFLAIEGSQAADSNRIHEVVNKLVKDITHSFQRRWHCGGTIHIEAIQDRVEIALMRVGNDSKMSVENAHQVARAYVVYREKRREMREKNAAPSSSDVIFSKLRVTNHQGESISLSSLKLDALVKTACTNLEDVNSDKILEDTQRNLFDGVPINDVYKSLIISASTLIEKEPNYSYVAARLLLKTLTQEALDFLNLTSITPETLDKNYTECLKTFIHKAIALELLDPELAKFDLDRLGQALQVKRNQQLAYLGLQTLYDRYFLHHQKIRFELPQIFFMRVAMGLAINEKQDREGYAIQFYDLLSSFNYMSSTPTLFNSGTLRPQLSSCFLTTIPDDLKGIYGSIQDNALLSKWAGGIGNDWTYVRAMGAYIKGTNGRSLGVVPFMNVADATAVAVNQGGKRKGAVCAYLETWHMDIEEFLELRKNTGDERRRTHDMNTANWVPDLFMKRVFEQSEWTLFSPDEVPDLHDLYGKAFEAAYLAYEKKAAEGKIRSRKIKAVDLWRKMLSLLFETGHPWITFKDACNVRSPQQHAGIIHSSNLCTEITLNTSQDEVAVCNLGSINLVNYMSKNGLDHTRLQKDIKVMIRMLDNVIDYNYYAIPQAMNSNLKHRPIGLGLMGFQDALYIQSIPYASQKAVDFSDRCMEAISYYAISASADLAEERGSYPSYPGSLWSQGILPFDSIERLAQERGKDYIKTDRSYSLDWDRLRDRVKQVGVRNSNIMAIAPTATISNICGVSQSIEPTYRNLFVKSNLSGEFTIINPYLVRDLKSIGIWDEVMINDLKYYDGVIQKIDRIPDSIKALYLTAFEVNHKWLIECAACRQKWIDQAQSLNLYIAKASGKKLDAMYRLAWLLGLKTTYYLRSMGASSGEKSTVNENALDAVKVCSISNPEDCEACQ